MCIKLSSKSPYFGESEYTMTPSFLQLMQFLLYMHLGNGPAIDFQSEHAFGIRSYGATATFNRVFFTHDVARQELDYAETFFNNKPFIAVIESSNTTAASVLESSNYRLSKEQWIMSLELNKISSQTHAQNQYTANYLSITEDITSWALLICQSFADYNYDDFMLFIRYIADRSNHENLHLFTVLDHESLVGSCLCIQHDKSMIIHLLATAREHRGKGIGTFITTQALTRAQQLGCTHAYLIATPAGLPLYQRLGFEKHTLLNYYKKPYAEARLWGSFNQQDIHVAK